MSVDFDARAASWDDDPEKRARGRAVAAAIRRMAVSRPGMNAMEYGCGTGLVSFELSADLGSILLVDSSRGMLDVCRRKIEAIGATHMRTMLLDLTTDPAPDRRFDLIYSSMTLHHVPDTAAMLSRWVSLLAPGGTLALADLDAEDGSFHGHHNTEVHHGFERQGLAELFRRTGLGGIRTESVHSIDRELAGGEPRSFPVFLMAGTRE